MRLDIQNIDRLIDSEYHNKRFICTSATETDTNYRFQFKDKGSLATRYVWVEIRRNGQWNDGKWEYRLNYPNCPEHIITADWLGFPPNAVGLMEECLHYSI